MPTNSNHLTCTEELMSKSSAYNKRHTNDHWAR